MSRSGCVGDYDDHWQFALYRGRVASVTRGKRGQKFFLAWYGGTTAASPEEARDLRIGFVSITDLGAEGRDD